MLNSNGAIPAIRGYTIDLSSSLLEASYFFFYNIVEGFDRLKSYPNLIKENASLKTELSAVKRQNILLSNVLIQNKRLNTLLALKKNMSFESIAARVIGYDVVNESKWIILNVGANDGVQSGFPVVIADGVVGKIVYVAEKTSRVILLLDKNSRISSLVQETRDIGIVEGNGSKSLVMRYIELNSQISVGDVIVSSGMGGIFPKGIPIGLVMSIEKESNGLFLLAHIKPFVVFNKLEEVLCLKTIK